MQSYSHPETPKASPSDSGPSRDGCAVHLDFITRAIGAALYFYDAEDAESVEMRAMLEQLTAEEFVEQVTGLEAGSGLFDAVRDEVDRVKRELAGS